MSIVEYDPWRAYDDVLVNWLTTIPLLKDKNGNTITPRPVFATPERPFGRTASSGS